MSTWSSGPSPWVKRRRETPDCLEPMPARHSGKPVEASEKKRPRFRARKGRSLVFGPAQSLLDVLLTELYFLAGCVCRLSLSQSLCSDARRAEEGADGTVAYKAADASRQRRQGQEWTGAHTRYGLYPRATRRGRGSRSSWPLGRRSSYRSKRHAHRDARRTPQPLYDARQASKEGHDDCGGRAR